ncbi:MAG TPA: rod shape-determining protein MreC [Pirellulales bacterium]|jgi:hypothetical protein|nr:rod shape-determining protein MreC [Pirellulales bacterium]
MTMRKRSTSRAGQARQATRTLMAILAVAGVLALAPEALRSRLQTSIREWVAAVPWPDASPVAPESSIAEAEAKLRRRNEELELALAAAEHESSAEASLLAPRLVQARVVGRLARRYLDPADLLGVGSNDQIGPESLVMQSDAPQLVDRGSDRGASEDQLLLVGRHVWGKIVEVGPRTALARPITDRRYRGVVQLARLEQGALRRGPRGLLEGSSDGTCRIRLVETVHAVAVDDWVLAEGAEGLTDLPLVYGRVTRAEHVAGAPHWEIGVAPAADQEATRLSILIGEARREETGWASLQ